MIIVTGGAGFIGRNLIQGLNSMGRTDIVVVDNLKNGLKYKNLLGLRIEDYFDKSYFLNSLLDTPDFLKDIEVVFHEGACTDTCEWDGSYMIENNYQYSKLLLCYCIKYAIPFIYASSAAVYGKSTNLFLKKKQMEFPVNLYGYSKFLFDNYVSNVLSQVKSQICGLRYFNVYGPYEFHKKNMASIILNLYNQIQKKTDPILFKGSENFKRDFIIVDDIVKINLWMWCNKISGIFDCGTGVAESFKFVSDLVLKFFGCNLIKYVSMPIHLMNHYQIFTQANIEPLRKIGYKNKFIDIKYGINQYLNWIRSYCS